MGEGLGVSPALLDRFLDVVVAYGSGRLHGFGEFPGIERDGFSALELTDYDRRGPDPGEAICLQLHSYREVIGLGRILLLLLSDLIVNSEEVLDVMADLMREDVCRSEVASRSEPGS